MNKCVVNPSFKKTISILSKRWNGLIIYTMLDGQQRFHSIESSIGISGRVLSERLKELEQLGIVKRVIFPETSVRIEYSLTEKGLAFKPILNEIEKWSNKWESTEQTS